MKIKFLSVICLTAIAGLAGCKSSDNTNVNRMNTNVNSNVAVMTPAAPVKDAAVETAVKDALTKKGFTDVTVEGTATQVTLRGTVAKGKMAELNQVAQETAKRKVINQVTEK